MVSDERRTTKPNFILSGYLPDHGVVGDVNQLIDEGQLPSDTMFRLMAVGREATSSGRLLNYILMQDMVKHVDSPDKMKDRTQEVLYGKLPDAVVDINMRINYKEYPKLDVLYYSIFDLARSIRHRREATGQAIPQQPYDRRLHTQQDERNRCLGLAKPLWRTIVNRFHPEWIANPHSQYPSGFVSFMTYYEIGEKLMQRGIVFNAVISDALVKSIYDESVETGVKGIGPVGREDLRLMLLEQHPDLAKGHELPADPAE